VTALDLARRAYSAPGTPARTLRGTEYDLFAQVTHRLKSVPSDGTKSFVALAEALHENCRLWTVLAADVAQPGNALPAPLRAQIFYLFQFTDRHSRKVLAGNGSVDILIEINTAIMRGLRGEGAQG
jgi:flagellar biosynthesis activator protein FlaF